jgi:hypothetical protein
MSGKTRRANARPLRVRDIRRDPPDLKRLGRALIAVALAQAQAEADAEASYPRKGEEERTRAA